MLVYQQGEHRPNAGVYFQELKSLHEREREGGIWCTAGRRTDMIQLSNLNFKDYQQ